MSFARITNLLPPKSMLETTLLTAAFVTIHVAAYLDRGQEIESNAAITLSLASKALATLHTSAALVKVWENFERAGQHVNPSNYKIASGTAITGSLGTLAGVWAAADSKANMVLGVTNAACNFFGRVFSAAHRRAVVSELEINFDTLDADLLETGQGERIVYNTLAK